MKLDIGCGKNKIKGCIGIDMVKTDATDYVLNIEKDKLPFKNNTADKIYCYHTLEHLSDIQYPISEMYRVMKKGAELEIRVPYYKHPNVVIPFHKLSFGFTSFDFYLKKSKRMDLEKQVYFKIKEKKFIFEGCDFFGIIPKIADKNPFVYERYLSHVFPARIIFFRMEK